MHGDDCKGRFGAHDFLADAIQDRFTRSEAVHRLPDFSFLVLHVVIPSLDQFFKVCFRLLQARAHGGSRTFGQIPLPAPPYLLGDDFNVLGEQLCGVKGLFGGLDVVDITH